MSSPPLPISVSLLFPADEPIAADATDENAVARLKRCWFPACRSP
jgi:hypothetical protein